jgi:hypothetical protein
MDVSAGPYTFTLPERENVSLDPPKQYPFSPQPLAQIGPFAFHATLSNDTLDNLKEHIGWTTKYEAKFADLEFNGVPGFMHIDTTGASSHRIDYVFKAQGSELLCIVATAEPAASLDQQAEIHSIVRTIRLNCAPPNNSLERTRER